MVQTFYKLKVQSIIRETGDTVSIILGIPEDLKESFAYKQGQYITIKHEFGGDEIRRSYSMSSSPLEDMLKFTVKKVSGGTMSVYLNEQLKEGDVLEVSHPDGHFFTPLHPEQQKFYYMFGAGSGITPLMSLIKTTLEVELLSTVHLFYGNREETAVIFREELDAMAKKYEGQFIMEYIYSGQGKSSGGMMSGWFKKTSDALAGRIDGKIAGKLLSRYPAGKKKSEFFLCGPGEMIEKVEAELRKQGVQKAQMHKEYFVSATPVGTDGPAPFDGAVELTVTLNGHTSQVKIPAEKTVLEGLILQKLDPPYSCSAGACSTCMAKLVSGQVKMDTCLALDDDEVANGYILTCQSRALTHQIEINYDA